MSEEIIISDTTKPKSDQLNFDDVAAKDITAKVVNVTKSEGDQPISVHLDQGLLPFKPCKSMRRVLIQAWGDNGREWIGKSLTLRGDPEVKFGGVKVGGIRISHLSHIERDLNMSLTVTRAKRAPFTVRPLKKAVQAEYPADLFDEKLPAMQSAITSGKMTAAQVIAQAEKTGKLTDKQKAAINETPEPGEEPEEEVF